MKIYYTIIYILLSLSVFVSCIKKSAEGLVIVTESYYGLNLQDSISGQFQRFPGQSRLVLVDPGKREKTGVVLTEKFYAAFSPDVSFDGRFVLFSGRIKKEDPLQIWEMDILSRKVRQVTRSGDNSADPAYLPGGKIVFSCCPVKDSLKAGFSLFTCNPDGTELRRITFNPHDYFASSVLKDGRVITISRQLYPERKGQEMMVLRPDGTKNELFYRNPEGAELRSRPWETGDGRILFIESCDPRNPGGKLVSVNYNRPLHTRKELIPSAPGDFFSVYPGENGKFLVSYRTGENDRFSLYEMDEEEMALKDPVYSGKEGNITEVVMVRVHERPKKLPSEVDFGVKTGLILCQNIHLTGMTSPESDFLPGTADQIEVLGIHSSLGKIKVDKDGSVYLKVAADMPFRIQTLDPAGNIVNGPGGWYYLRPNERRGCVGCHEDPEITPANRYAIAVSKNPVVIPVHVEGIQEKEVELE